VNPSEETAVSKLTLDHDTISKLVDEYGPRELYDPAGKLVGYLTPPWWPKPPLPPLSEAEIAELEREANDPNTKWHTPDEVMARLRSLRKGGG
jgi:hypothetical protein